MLTGRIKDQFINWYGKEKCQIGDLGLMQTEKNTTSY